ncbi:MAG: NnrU family protein [Chloroflexota bacterium]
MTGLILSFLFFAVLHSITAAQWFKDRVVGLFGLGVYKGFYRLFYSAVSVLTLLPFVYFYFQLPDQPLYTIPFPWLWLFALVQMAGLLGLVLSVLQSGALAFVGISQLIDYMSGRDVGQGSGLGETLVVHGLYRYMRHPLYTFSMLLLWANPWMTRNNLILTILISAYFIIGSYIEENRLTSDFGESYSRYKGTVARFVPYIW